MKFTKAGRTAAVVLTCLLACGSGHAQSAEKKAKVEEYFRLIHLEASIDQMMDQVQSQMQKAVTQFAPDSAE